MFDEYDELKYHDYIEISNFLMKFPFNISLVGYKMLLHSIMIILQNKSRGINLTKEVYSLVARHNSMSVKSVEKAIRNTIVSASNICSVCDYVEYPNFAIKNALLEARPKAFICTVCEYLSYKKRLELYIKKQALQ